MSLKTIETVSIDVNAFKHGDTTVDFHLNLSNIYGSPVKPDSSHTFTAKVANVSGHFADYPCKIDRASLVIDSDEFVQLPPDSYQMEIWETWTNDDGSHDTAIYPSPTATLPFKVNPNIEDKNGKLVKTIDFKEVVGDAVKQYLKDHPGAATGSDFDLSKYYTKDEMDTKLGNFAKKDSLPDIKLDVMKRELSVDGKVVKIPADVDLSKYALKSDVPEVIYDADKHLLAINGQKVELPSNVDLSDYYTKSEVDDKLAKAASGGKVDLTGYLTKTEADQTYATKAELPDMTNVATKDEIPSTDGLVKETELSDYAKKTDIPATPDLSSYATQTELANYAKLDVVPSVQLDLDKRQLIINGQTISVPDNVDLSHYYTKDEVDSKIATAVTGGKVDLTGYLTKVDADQAYAAKNDVPEVSLDVDQRTLYLNGESIQIPAAIDLSGYLTKADADLKYANKSDIPSLDGYAKATDLDSYAKKTDIPKIPDMSQYATNASVDEKVNAAKPDLSGITKDVSANKADISKMTSNLNAVSANASSAIEAVTSQSAALSSVTDMAQQGFNTANAAMDKAIDAMGKAEQATSKQSKSIKNVKDFGAVGDNKTDDTIAIQKAINATKDNGGLVYFPSGKYKITKNLIIYTGTTLKGESQISTRIAQTGTDYHIIGTDISFVTIQDLTFEGPGMDSAGGGGINIMRKQAANTEGLNFENVTVQHCATAHGIGVSTPITSVFNNVRVIGCVGHAFNIYGSGTSITFNACYAITCTQAGFYLNQLNYSTLISCAAETCGVDFYLANNCNNVALVGCGSEDAIKRRSVDGVDYLGVDYQIDGGVGNSLISCYSRNNVYAGILAKNTQLSVSGYRQIGNAQYAINADASSKIIGSNNNYTSKAQGDIIDGSSIVDYDKIAKSDQAYIDNQILNGKW